MDGAHFWGRPRVQDIRAWPDRWIEFFIILAAIGFVAILLALLALVVFLLALAGYGMVAGLTVDSPLAIVAFSLLIVLVLASLIAASGMRARRRAYRARVAQAHMLFAESGELAEQLAEQRQAILDKHRGQA